MQKISGHICDNCRTMFKPNEPIIELCQKCANTVWCVFAWTIDENSDMIFSVHHTYEGAEDWINQIDCIKHYKIQEFCIL